MVLNPHVPERLCRSGSGDDGGACAGSVLHLMCEDADCSTVGSGGRDSDQMLECVTCPWNI